MVKDHRMKRVVYDPEFQEELDMFERNIQVDPDIDKLKLKNKNQRFSAAIRWFIRGYNKKKAALRLAAKEAKQGASK